MNILIIGGGMITREVIIPATQVFFRDHPGRLAVATRRARTIGLIREEFPALDFDARPDPDRTGPDESHPEAWKKALEQLQPPGAVIIATPDHLHTEPIIAAVERGFDCIVEKPLCLTMEDARRISRAAAAADRYVYTDYHKRHDMALRAVRHRYSTGEMGEALSGTAHIEERREMPLKHFALWCAQSSPFEYIGCHYVDMYHFVTGLKPVAVTAFGQKKLLPSLGHDAWDAVEALVEWENGSVLFVQSSWILPDGNPNLTNQGFQITCTQGEFRADNADRNSNFSTQSRGYEKFNPHFCKPYNDWDEPEKTVWEGYGLDSILQPLRDIAALAAADRAGDRAARRRLLERFRRTRPLPEQASLSTAVMTAAKRSLAEKNSRVPVETL